MRQEKHTAVENGDARPAITSYASAPSNGPAADIRKRRSTPESRVDLAADDKSPGTSNMPRLVEHSVCSVNLPAEVGSHVSRTKVFAVQANARNNAKRDVKGISSKTLTNIRDATPPRPLNAWILYRCNKVKELRAAKGAESAPMPLSTSPSPTIWSTFCGAKAVAPAVEQAEISRIVSTMWKNEAKHVKQHYKNLAEEKKRTHEQMYPDYKYQPRRPRNNLLRQSNNDGDQVTRPRVNRPVERAHIKTDDTSTTAQTATSLSSLPRLDSQDASRIEALPASSSANCFLPASKSVDLFDTPFQSEAEHKRKSKRHWQQHTSRNEGSLVLAFQTSAIEVWVRKVDHTNFNDNQRIDKNSQSCPASRNVALSALATDVLPEYYPWSEAAAAAAAGSACEDQGQTVASMHQKATQDLFLDAKQTFISAFGPWKSRDTTTEFHDDEEFLSPQSFASLLRSQNNPTRAHGWTFNHCSTPLCSSGSSLHIRENTVPMSPYRTYSSSSLSLFGKDQPTFDEHITQMGIQTPANYASFAFSNMPQMDEADAYTQLPSIDNQWGVW